MFVPNKFWYLKKPVKPTNNIIYELHHKYDKRSMISPSMYIDEEMIEDERLGCILYPTNDDPYTFEREWIYEKIFDSKSLEEVIEYAKCKSKEVDRPINHWEHFHEDRDDLIIKFTSKYKPNSISFAYQHDPFDVLSDHHIFWIVTREIEI